MRSVEGSVRCPRSQKWKQQQRLVVFRPGALGDTLVAAPVIWSLRKEFPDTRIEYLSEEHAKSSIIAPSDVAGLIPEIDRTYQYSPSAGWRVRLRKLRSRIMPCREDILVYLCYQRTSAFKILRDWIFFALLGFRKFIGFRDAFKDAVRGNVSDSTETEYERLFRIASSSGICLDRSACGTLRTDNAWGEEFWHKNKLNDSTVIAMCPGSKMQAKRWPAERYAQVITELDKYARLSFILIGDDNDRDVAEYICHNTTATVISAVGTTLLQTSTILSRVKTYLGNDTGPMHMAALHGIPCVAIFSARDREKKWYPWGEKHIILRAEIECTGCMLQTCFATPPECLSKIDVELVIESVKRILNMLSV